METKTLIASRIQEYLNREGISQRELARRVGIANSTISKWTSKENEPTASMLVTLAMKLGVTLDWLTGMDSKKIRIPNRGERFTFKGITFVALSVSDDGVMAITDKPICDMPFDENDSDDWRESTLREYLNDEWLKKIGSENLRVTTASLMGDDGDNAYGITRDYVSLLTCEEYRLHRDIIPKMDSYWWTMTPWSPSCAHIVRLVYTSGALDLDYASYSCGVVPRLTFSLENFSND